MIDRHRLSRLADRAAARECRHSMKPGVAIDQTARELSLISGVICTTPPGGSDKFRIKRLKCERYAGIASAHNNER